MQGIELVSEQAEKVRPKIPELTGEWATDCRNGRTFARDTVLFMAETGNPGHLGSVIDGLRGGVRAGFCNAIAVLLIETA